MAFGFLGKVRLNSVASSPIPRPPTINSRLTLFFVRRFFSGDSHESRVFAIICKRPSVSSRDSFLMDAACVSVASESVRRALIIESDVT